MMARQKLSPLDQQLLFRRIHLVNFVIHRNTSIQLDSSPVVLISGSNGSGKTLILDALLFAMGVESRRAQRQRNAGFIGRFNKYAEVRLELSNFRLNGRRVLRSPESELDKLLNNDLITIRLRIHSNNRIIYWLNEQRSINGRQLTRKDIRKLFQVAGLFGDSPLAVTEAETLDHFASQSPHRKFETLLNETGLRNWMEKLEEARLLVLQARANVKPLQYRIRHEEQRLHLLKAAFEAFQQKQQLQERLNTLDIEAAWAEVAYREELAEQLQEQIAQLDTQLSKENAAFENLNKRYAELDLKNKSLKSKIEKLQMTMESVRDQEMQARGHRRGLENELIALNAQIERYGQSKRQKPSKISEQNLQVELNDLREERDRLDNQLDNIRQQIASTEEELFTEPQRYSYYEEAILKACQRFRAELDTIALSDSVIGPLFTLIRMKPNYHQIEDSVKMALGRYNYAFIALNRNAFAEAKALFDHLWPTDKPDIVVARTNPTTELMHDRPSVVPPVFGWAVDLIDGDVYAVSFLSRVVNTAIAEESAEPNELVDAAQQLHGNIITSDGMSFYLRIGAFTRPPRSVAVNLGSSLRELALIQDTADIRRQLRELREQEAKLMQHRLRLNSESQQLRSRLQDLHHESTQDSSVEEKTSIVADLENRVTELQQQIIELDTQSDALSQEYQEYNSKLSPLNTRLQKIDGQLQNVQNRRSRHIAAIEQISSEYHQREDEYEHLILQIKEFRKSAQILANRPQEIRMPQVIRDEQLQIQAMINTITATADDSQAFQEQEKVVQHLKEYLEQRQLHLENLMTDVERRLMEWRRQLEETIEILNHRMNQLLSHFLKQVKLIVRYPDEPSRAELHLQLAINRKGEWRTYQEMSGGERVLSTQTFILALHTLAKSPLHVVDEFTQRLDEASRAAVLSVVQRALDLSQEGAIIPPQFLLMAPTTVGLEIPKSIHHVVLIKGEVKN